MKAEIKSAIITGIFGVIGAIIAAYIGNQVGKQSIISEINAEIANVTGDNNQITINDLGEILSDYEYIRDEKKQLQSLNTQYFEQLNEYKKEIESLNLKVTKL